MMVSNCTDHDYTKFTSSVALEKSYINSQNPDLFTTDASYLDNSVDFVSPTSPHRRTPTPHSSSTIFSDSSFTIFEESPVINASTPSTTHWTHYYAEEISRLKKIRELEEKVQRQEENHRAIVQQQEELLKLRSEVNSLKSQIARNKCQYNRLQQRDESFKQNLMIRFGDDQLGALAKGGNAQGVKWTNETITKAIPILFSAGPKGYELVSTTQMPLPSVRTIQERLQSFKFNPGILTDVMSLLPLKVEGMKENHRECMMGFDEMAIKGQKDFDTNTMNTIGLCTLPTPKKKLNKTLRPELNNDPVRIEEVEGAESLRSLSTVAEKALVFIIGGIQKRYKQSVGYHFTSKSFDGDMAKEFIVAIIAQIYAIGLMCRVLVSDMGMRHVWRSFGIDVGPNTLKNWIPHPCDSSEKLYIIADSVHVFKAILEMLKSNVVIYLSEEIVTKHSLPTNEVKLQDLLDLCAFQKNLRWKLAPKLKKIFLQKKHFFKMRVGTASAVLSKKTAAALIFLSDLPEGNPGMFTTAWFILVVAEWFKYMSARSPQLALSRLNPHALQKARDSLQLAIDIFQTLKAGKEWKPCQTGLKSCTQCVLDLSVYYLEERGDKFKMLMPGMLTQDIAKSVFAVIRSFTSKPSPVQFKNGLKSISVSHFLRPIPKSCYEFDDRHDLAEFLDVNPAQNREVESEEDPCTVAESDVQTILSLTGGNIQASSTVSEVEKYPLYRVSGYVLHEVFKENAELAACSCCVDFCRHKKDEPHSYAFLTRLTNYAENCLFEPSDLAFNLLFALEQRFVSFEHEMPFIFLDNREYAYHKLKDIVESATHFPKCHNLPDVIARRYISFRLKQVSWTKNEAINSYSAAFSSRTMGASYLADNLVIRH